MLRPRRGMRGALLLILLLACLAPPHTLAALPPDDGSDIRVSILTMEPGDAGYEKFGHIALRIQDPQARYPDLAYNWGLFDFNQKNFYYNFIQGRMIYSVGAFDAPETIGLYRQSSRTVWEQVLHLSGDQKLEFERRCLIATRPENRNYRYDYYLDNCSTRVRDVIDAVVRGSVRREFHDAPAGATFRFHTQRLLSDDIPLYVALQAVLGHPVDRPITRWEEMFLPEKLREHLQSATVPGPDGKPVPLIESQSVLCQGTRPPVRTTPPHDIPVFLAAGVGIGATVVVLAALTLRKRRGARAAFIIISGAWLLLMGLGGALIAWGWLGTDHAVARSNENVLQVNFLCLALLALLPRSSRGKSRWAPRVAAVVTALSVMGLALKMTPFFFQGNGDIISLCLPVHLAICGSFWWLARGGGRLPLVPGTTALQPLRGGQAAEAAL